MRVGTIDTLLFTCEHGGNGVPAPLRKLFRVRRALLDSHRGYDRGALVMAKALAGCFDAPLVPSKVSRLVVDLNRSLGHPQLFSAATRALPAALRDDIVARHHRPYRAKVEELVHAAVSRGERVVHISSHSFTPTLDGVERDADVGLLYDPRRPGEVEWCKRWQAALATLAPDFRVRRNYPYAGKADGLTCHLRRRFPPDAYVGIELEVNQRIVTSAGRRWPFLRMALVDSLRDTCVAGADATQASTMTPPPLSARRGPTLTGES